MWNLARYLSGKYLFAKSNAVAVNFIAWVAILALAFSTAALFVILSVFSGLERLNLQLYSDTNPHLRIASKQGKWLPKLSELSKSLEAEKGVVAFSKIIEEKVYLRYGQKEDIAYLLGVDANFPKVLPTENMLLDIDSVNRQASWLDLQGGTTIYPSVEVARRLELYYDVQNPAKLMMPKAGQGLITSEQEDFVSRLAFAKGRFFYNDKWKQYILSDISIAQRLLQDSTYEKCYAILVRLADKEMQIKTKEKLLQKLGNDTYLIETQAEQDAAFLRLMNIEKLIIYLIFLMVIGIASFSLIGAIVVIILEKQKQFLALRSLGLNAVEIRQVFYVLGLRICAIALTAGLLLGLTVCWLQSTFSLVMATEMQPFPVRITLENLFVVASTVAVIGVLISYLVSRRATYAPKQ